MISKLSFTTPLEMVVSVTIEEIKGKSNLFKAITKRNGSVHELMVFALDDDQFNKIVKNENSNTENNVIQTNAKSTK